MKKMTDWLRGLKLTFGVLITVAVGGVTVGASLDGMLTLPGTVERLARSHSADSLITQQNQRAVIDLRIVTTELTDGLDELLERVRTIDRRTCITAATGEEDLQECANR